MKLTDDQKAWRRGARERGLNAVSLVRLNSSHAADEAIRAAKCAFHAHPELREPLIQPAVRTDLPLECMLTEEDWVAE